MVIDRKVLFLLILHCTSNRSDGSGPKIFDLGRVNFLWLESVGISQLWLRFELGKFPLKTSNFSSFSLRVKKNLFGLGWKVPRSKAGLPLIYYGSKVHSGRVRSGPISNIKCLAFHLRKKLTDLLEKMFFSELNLKASYQLRLQVSIESLLE